MVKILWRVGDNVEVALLDVPEEEEALILFFEQIAEEETWQPEDQLHAYKESSIYFAAFVGQELAGGVQLVLGGQATNLPCLSVWPELALQGRTDIADVAVFAFRHEYRGKFELFWRLLVEVWRYSHAAGIEELWMEITPRILRLYLRLGMPVETAGPLRPHWGEECFPCRVGVRELEQVFVEKARYAPLFASLVAQAYRDRSAPANTLLENGGILEKTG